MSNGRISGKHIFVCLLFSFVFATLSATVISGVACGLEIGLGDIAIAGSDAMGADRRHLVVSSAKSTGSLTNGEACVVANVVITPSNPSLSVGTQVTFTASGYDSAGNPCPITDPHWETDTSYGTIVPDPQDPAKCVFTATAEGSGYIACYNGPPENDPVYGSTDIAIENDAPQLARIEVTPDKGATTN